MDGCACVSDSRRKLVTMICALAAARLVGHSISGASATLPEERAERLPLRDVRFQNHTGNGLALEKFRGRVVLLNLWATWCVPCRKEMPSLDRLQRQHGGPGFEVVAVSVDRSAQAVREFFRQHGIKSLALYLDPSGAVASTLGVIGIPATLLVDRDGREIWRLAGPAEWDAPQSVRAIRKHVEAGARR